ncbi:hypothetical protein RYX36_026999, partial [Vicia faba]
VASVTAVLAMYLASLEKNYWLSALVRCCIRYCCAGHVSCKFGKELLVKCI